LARDLGVVFGQRSQLSWDLPLRDSFPIRQFLIAERQVHGTTLLLTTHDMSDVERLCERVLVVDHGRLVYDGTLSDLTLRVAPQRMLVVDLWEPTVRFR
jgi:ABC-type uncharacterized transport system ATPase subunit